MAENFYVEALVLMILTYAILIIIILRIALMLCQFTFKSETDQMKRAAKKQSSSLQNVIIVKSNENEKNSNRNHSLCACKKYHEYSERPVKNDNLPIPAKHQIISAGLSEENRYHHPVAKQDCPSGSKFDVTQSKFITPSSVSSGVTQSEQERINDDDSFWRQSFQEESELSKESTTIPHTSAYGMRKIGKKTYIE
ncbi:unnamed protein product [Onchocerca ochengi]|uniref:DUF4408 domain-containing protein n=1 Tax=Onchocerca ochengi TaxID=42157 RepID=A0A182ES24_ONCOC|nr:unnamed protein product [Onchocerca ochengi]